MLREGLMRNIGGARSGWMLLCGVLFASAMLVSIGILHPSYRNLSLPLSTRDAKCNHITKSYERYIKTMASNQDATPEELIRHSNMLAASYYPASKITPFPTSFWFVKNVKVGGSSLAGVMRSLCAHYGMACINPPGEPGARIGWKKEDEIISAAQAAKDVGFEHLAVTNHGKYMPKAAASLVKPLLFTMIRHPVGRTLSAYFYNLLGSHRSHEGLPIEMGKECVDLLQSGKHCSLLDGFEEHFVNGNGTFGRNHMFKYIQGNKKNAAAAFEQYDFVFVTERFDESLVAFMLTYGLTMRDIAYLRMKDRSGTYPKEKDVPKDMVDLILQNNQEDLKLWNLSMAALDKRILELKEAGHDFDETLEKFSKLQAIVEHECANYEGWYKENGFDTMLTYWGKDNGAGNRCIQSAVRIAGYG